MTIVREGLLNQRLVMIHVSQSRKECVLIPFQIAWQKIQESAKQQRKAGGAQGVAAC